VQIKIVQDAAARFLSDNATTVLTAGGVVGTAATAFLAWRGGYKAAQVITAEESRRTAEDAEPVSPKEKFRMAAPHFVPPIASGSLTIAAIVMAHRMSATKAAALAAAYGVSQRQLDEYKAKVAEKLTGTKREQVQDELAQERANRNPNSSQIIVLGDDVLCYDQPTDRYFRSTMEKLRSAENAANAEIIHHGYCPATFFYDELELEPTTWTTNMGWCQPFRLEITTIQARDGRPCLAIDFDKLPIEDFVRGQPSQYS
jgi:hypothetical protein